MPTRVFFILGGFTWKGSPQLCTRHKTRFSGSVKELAASRSSSSCLALGLSASEEDSAAILSSSLRRRKSAIRRQRERSYSNCIFYGGVFYNLNKLT